MEGLDTEEYARLQAAERRARLDADRARQHLRLLGDASRRLMQPSSDYDQALREVVAGLPADFVSVAAIFLADSKTGSLRRVAVRPVDANPLSPLDGSDLLPIRRAMAAGRSEIVLLEGPEARPTDTDPIASALAASGIRSYVISPILIRGLAFGVLLLAAGEGVRGYRRADRGAIDELSRRIALSIEANQLYREARANEAAGARSLARLRSLIDTKLMISAASSRREILTLAANGAQQLFPGTHVIAAYRDEQCDATGLPGNWLLPATLNRLMHRNETVVDSPLVAAEFDPVDRGVLGQHWMAAPCGVGTAGEQAVILVGDSDEPFSGEDDSLLTLLARMCSTALSNASLIQQTRGTAARLSAIVNASPAAIVVMDLDLAIVGVNPAAEALFGWGPAGEPTLPSELDEQLGRLVADAGMTRRATRLDTVVDIDGTERTLLLMLAPVGADGAVVEGYVLVVTDDTDRQHLLRDFQHAQRMEAVGRLAGGIAHDFNNLLTVILGYADGMLRRLPADDPNRARVEAIHRAGTRGADLTRRLLSISRHDMTAPVVLEPMAVIRENHDMIRRLVGENVNVVVQPGGEGLRVRIDKLQLEQMLLNLAANARDAMPEGGDVVIGVRQREPDVRRATREAPAPTVEIRVTDYGSGMDEDTLARCMDPLFTTKQAGQGTGLGLSTVYGIASQAGGDVRIDSSPGLGTTVRLLLPQVVDEVTATDEDPLPEPGVEQPTGSESILVVDDESEIREMVAAILEMFGYEPVVAASGAEALKMLEDREWRIDAVLTDVAMPGMDGPQLARAVIARCDVPVVFMSGYAERLTDQDDDTAVPGSFLAKPFTPENLEQALRDALAGSAEVTGHGPGHGSKR